MTESEFNQIEIDAREAMARLYSACEETDNNFKETLDDVVFNVITDYRD